MTAERWVLIFAQLGFRVFAEAEWSGEPCDLLVALHAGHSHDSILRFRARYPGRPCFVAATGTDVYGDHPLSPEVQDSLRNASRIVVLQPLAIERLPPEVRDRARVVRQSVRVPAIRTAKVTVAFQVCAVAHLRPVKDPLLPARAIRLLPAHSRIRVVHLGAALDDAMKEEVERERRENARFLWAGERPHQEALAVLDSSHLFVSSSRHEGGSNAVSEALAFGIPVLATAIPGSIGLLGADHPGLYPVGDARALADLMRRAETDAAFLAELARRSQALAPLTDPARELEGWRALLAEVAG